MRHHLPTLIVMTVVAGPLLALNLVPWGYHLAVPTLEHLGNAWYGYGWPAPFARQLEPDLLAALTRDLRSFPFFIDLGFALFLTVGAGWICERWLELRQLTGGFQVRRPATPHR